MLSDSIASAVAFCAVYVMGVLLDRLIGGEPSPSSSTVNDRSVDGVNIQNQRQRAVVSACLSVLNFVRNFLVPPSSIVFFLISFLFYSAHVSNFVLLVPLAQTAATGMLLLAVGTSSAQVGHAHPG